ncbi:MAG: ABC transporter substrate-binding protein [Candidatus Omnitrophica bacterium]|jgi:1,4-dihydroxy-6-naphthoate synthase|nr:ABC transporter substrate-binding protein [Candidatus Omnitrophota bacterium]
MAMVKGKIRVGHSPDADDAFMFYGIACGAVDTDGLTISHVVEDIQSLNERSFRGELEVTAISAYTYFEVADKYTLMSCGASIGDNYGPVLVSKTLNYPKEVKGKRVAVPGKYTTAYLMLKLYEPDIEAVFVPFDEVFATLDRGDVDAALIIHEGQVTYKDLGYTKMLDLGEWYYEMTKLPLPLGVDCVRTNLGKDLMRKCQRVFRDSIIHALEHREEAIEYAMKYGRSTPKDTIDRFVGMYVNELTVSMGKRGKDGLIHLHESAKAAGLLKNDHAISFVPA